MATPGKPHAIPRLNAINCHLPLKNPAGWKLILDFISSPTPSPPIPYFTALTSTSTGASRIRMNSGAMAGSNTGVAYMTESRR